MSDAGGPNSGGNPPGANGPGGPAAPPAGGAPLLVVPGPSSSGGKVGSLIIFGAVCGFALIATAIAAPKFDDTVAQFRWPMIAVGLAIIMGAVGAEVTANLKWVSAGGAAAMVLVFAKLFTIPPPESKYIYGYLRGTEQLKGLSIGTDERLLLSGRTIEGGIFHFMADKSDMKGRFIVIKFENSPGKLPDVVTFNCIPIKKLINSPESGRIDFYIENDKKDQSGQRWFLRDVDTDVVVSESGVQNCYNMNKPKLEITMIVDRFFSEFIVSTAHAQPLRDAKGIIEDIDSTSFDAQVRAQAGIGRLRDSKAIADLTAAWTLARANTRAEAILVAGFVDAIRQNREVAAIVAQNVSRQHMLRLIELAGGKDRDVRYSATELISWILQSMAWPGAPSEIQRKILFDSTMYPFKKTEDFYLSAVNKDRNDMRNSIYNLTVALNDANCDMRPDQREEMVSVLKAFDQDPFVVGDSLKLTRDQTRKLVSASCPSAR